MRAPDAGLETRPMVVTAASPKPAVAASQPKPGGVASGDVCRKLGRYVFTIPVCPMMNTKNTTNSSQMFLFLSSTRQSLKPPSTL